MSMSLPLPSSEKAKHGVPDFDRLARAYRWMEYLSFGTALMRCRTEFISRLAGCRHALVIGDGDGRFTAKLLEANAEIKVDATDASQAMLRALCCRAGDHSDRVRTQVADARTWQPNDTESYDLIVTHFFLDCLTTGEAGALADRIRSAARPGALWVVSEFAVPRSVFGAIVARPLVRALYFAFGLLTGLGICELPDYASAMEAAGFRRIEKRSRICGLLMSELWIKV